LLPGQRLQGQRQTWFCGAWTGYGFHEDGLKAGQRVGHTLLDDARTRHEAPADVMQEELA
jgi:predicted NAD/FAD-binding protein